MVFGTQSLVILDPPLGELEQNVEAVHPNFTGLRIDAGPGIDHKALLQLPEVPDIPQGVEDSQDPSRVLRPSSLCFGIRHGR